MKATFINISKISFLCYPALVLGGHAMMSGCFKPGDQLSKAQSAGPRPSSARFQSFREDGRSGFEGIYLRVTATPTKSADVLFRSLGAHEDKLSEACKKASQSGGSGAEAAPPVPAGLTWRIYPFGPSMGDFIYVPSEDLNISASHGCVKGALTFLASDQKNLQIEKDEATGSLTLEAIDTARGRALFESIMSDANLFRSTSVAGRTIDTSDSEWALDLTNTKAAHQEFFLAKGKSPGEGARVSVIDTGVTDHPELRGIRLVPTNQLKGGDGSFIATEDQRALVAFLQGSSFSPLARLGHFLGGFTSTQNSLRDWGPLRNPNHGTSSVSLVASLPRQPNGGNDPDADPLGYSVTGTAYGAEILIAKISNSVVLLTGKAAAQAIRWSVDNGADVISMSVGGLSTDDLFQATEYAHKRGVILVAAAGTGTGSITVYPASYPSVVGVTSVDDMCQADDQTAYSNLIDVAGPGKNAWFAWTLRHPKRNENTYLVRRAFGTSLSTPHVAGIAALWVAHHGRDKLRERFGQENIPWLFKYLLQAQVEGQPRAVHDCDGRFANNTSSKPLGSGVIDAKALLSIDLNTIDRSTIEAYAAGKLENGIRPPGAGLGVQAKENLAQLRKAMLRSLTGNE